MDVQELKKYIDYNPTTGAIRRIKTNKIIDSLSTTGYLRISFKNKRYYSHRIAWLCTYGSIPSGWTIDHIDGNRTNNKITNLRVVPQKINTRNQRRRKTNTSGFNGVVRSGGLGKRWTARLKIGNKNFYLGTFDTKEEAFTMRKLVEGDFNFHENHGL